MRFLDPAGTIWLDGERVEPSRALLAVTDPAVQFGLGVFESLAVRGGRPLERDGHLGRIVSCAGRLGVPLPDRDVLASAMDEIAAGLEGGYGWLRVIASWSGRCAVFAGIMDDSEEGKPSTAVLLRGRKNPDDPLAGLKSLNYAANVLGLEEARRRGADEGIWLNTRGHLAEGCSSNLFVVRGRRVFTPAASEGILPGIVRGIAMQAARDLGYAVHEVRLRLPRLLQASEGFLTSSTRGVRPLVAFEGKPVGSGRPGPVTRAVAAEVARRRGIAPGTGSALE